MTVYLLYTTVFNSLTLAWLLLIWTNPIFGIVLYLIFNLQPRRLFSSKSTHLFDYTNTPTAIPTEWAFLNKLAPSVSLPYFTQSYKTTLYTKNTEMVDHIVRSINEAKEIIIITTYIFKPDSVGMVIFNALKNAVKRGVKVYVLVDPIGSKLFISWGKILYSFRKSGIHFRLFFPLINPKYWLLINIRLHSKIVCIDQSYAYIGSLNLWNKNINAQENTELTIRVNGPIVGQIQTVAQHYWSVATRQIIPITQKVYTHLPQSNQPIRVLFRDMLNASQSIITILSTMLERANKSIIIWTPYFSPNTHMIQSLINAHNRGVNVQIMIPLKGNHFYLNQAHKILIKKLKEKGLQIYLSKPPLDHTKAVLIDDTWGMCGSSNFDGRSMLINMETNLEFMDQTLIQQIRSAFEKRKKTANQLIHPLKISFFTRLIGNIVLLFRPIF